MPGNIAAEVPDLSEAVLANLQGDEPEVPTGTAAEAPPETPAIPEEADEGEQAPEEAPPEETPEDVIAGLPQEVIDEIIRRRGPDSEHLKELLRREQQTTSDRLVSEQERLRTQQEDTARILGAGKTAITQIGSLIAAAQKGIENGEARLDAPALYQAIDQYRNAWVAGQATTWNSELQQEYTSQAIVAATFGEAEAERLAMALKASNRAGTRAPLLKEMFTLLTEKALEQGYHMGLEDVKKLGERQKTLEEKKDGLLKLKGAIPTKQPTGGPAKPSADWDIIRRHGDGEDVSEKEVNAARRRLGIA